MYKCTLPLRPNRGLSKTTKRIFSAKGVPPPLHSVIMMIELNMFSGSTSMIVIMGMVKMIMIIVMIDHDNHDDHDNRDDKDEYVHWLSISDSNHGDGEDVHNNRDDRS